MNSDTAGEPASPRCSGPGTLRPSPSSATPKALRSLPADRPIACHARIAARCFKGLTLCRGCGCGRAAAAPVPSCGAVTCAERFTATARPPRGARPMAVSGASRCARCAARRRRFASQPTFCYLCGQEGDAERAHGSRPGRLAQSPRRLEVLAGGGSADHRECEGGILSDRLRAGALLTPAAASCLRAHARFCVRFAARWCAVRCLTAPLIPRQSAYALEHTCSFRVKLISIQWFRNFRYTGDSTAEAPCTTRELSRTTRCMLESIRPVATVFGFSRIVGTSAGAECAARRRAGGACHGSADSRRQAHTSESGNVGSGYARPGGHLRRPDPACPSFAVDKCAGAVATAG